jgi:hypothetical protein
VQLACAGALASFTSSPLPLERPFDTVVLSVNVACSPEAALGLAGLVSVRARGEWSPWFRLLRWGIPEIRAGELHADWGQVDVDQLRLPLPAHEVRCRVTWQSPDALCNLKRVALCLSRTQEAWQPAARVQRPVRLEVPFFSQWDVTGHSPGRVCSPTCLAMVARFHGADVTPDDVATLAFDRDFDLYGNWSVNMLAMSILGFRAVIDRAPGLAQLDAALDAGQPVITSIAFGRNELRGSPLEQTHGHLVVVCGRTERGDYLARDPAARGRDDWREYSRSEFERAWLGHGGVSYRIQKEGGF